MRLLYSLALFSSIALIAYKITPDDWKNFVSKTKPADIVAAIKGEPQLPVAPTPPSAKILAKKPYTPPPREKSRQEKNHTSPKTTRSAPTQNAEEQKTQKPALDPTSAEWNKRPLDASSYASLGHPTEEKWLRKLSGPQVDYMLMKRQDDLQRQKRCSVTRCKRETEGVAIVGIEAKTDSHLADTSLDGKVATGNVVQDEPALVLK
jgi:hypothetical protein